MSQHTSPSKTTVNTLDEVNHVRNPPNSSVSCTEGLKFSESGSINTYEDLENILNSTLCYHPKCSFAYNITKERLKTASLITECIPPETYQRLSKLWDLDPDAAPRQHGNACQMKNPEEENRRLEAYLKNVERDMGIRSEVSEDLQLDADSKQQPEEKVEVKTDFKDNPYLKFVKKANALDLQTKTKKSLPKAATKITKKIINNFLQWYQTLGGNDNEILIDETTLSELFQIGFELPESKALVVKIKELPTVPECLAELTDEPKHSTRYTLRELLKQDIVLENLPLKMTAFGKMLPKEYPPLRFKPPRNFVRKTWMECQRVKNDLDTMSAVWLGLERLRSTVAFANWLKNHPEVPPPAHLQRKGLLKINYEDWNIKYKGFEVEVDPGSMPSTDGNFDAEKETLGDIKYSINGSERFDSNPSI